jgi:L-2-hydroxyglutarate oxidase LhgO
MSELVTCDTAVIGAGVVGLALARAFAQLGDSVIVLEAETQIGAHTSSRNSEVIHAGIYYPTGSLKAQWCVRGRDLLYAYCAQHQVEHRRLGKLIIACDPGEEQKLARILRQAQDNGVDDLRWLTLAEITELEPNVRACAGLFSPSTGIIDSHGLMAAFKRDAEQSGAIVQLRTRVLGAEPGQDGFVLRFNAGGDADSLHCKRLINSAGLWAPTLTPDLLPNLPYAGPQAHFAKGHYFYLSGACPFRHLVYPVPAAHGLGVHVTLDLAGRARFGPDVSFCEGIDYAFDESRAQQFAEAIRRYYPAIDVAQLIPGYVGVRPKLGPESAPASDFIVHGPEQHGQAGLVCLLGIESPGLTASLALAEHVVALLGAA